MYYQALKEKIEKKEALVGVIGLGYVGLPLAVEMAKTGFKVVGIDVNPHKVDMLKKGQSYVIDVKSKDVEEVVARGYLQPTTDFSGLKRVDAVSICVPTPLSKSKDPDVSYIKSAVEKIKENMHPGMLIILESTTYPGTTEELIQWELEALGYRVGEDFFLCFSPERVDPGNPVYNTKNTPKVIGGTTSRCVELAKALYGSILDHVYLVSSTRVAEMVKLLENTFRSVNIALVNEIAMMCDRMAIDVWEVIEAASTKPFGFMPFYPGPGIGGHCIPLDPMYLSWKARMYDFYNKFIDLASDINGNMPRYVVGKIGELLNLYNKCVKGSRILILGIAYKRDIDDLRESPALDIIDLLEERGAWVDYHDPYVPEYRSRCRVMYSVNLTPEKIASYDLVVLVTDHTCFDYLEIARHARLIFDTRNGFKNVKAPHIFKLGTSLPAVVPEEAAREAAATRE